MVAGLNIKRLCAQISHFWPPSASFSSIRTLKTWFNVDKNNTQSAEWLGCSCLSLCGRVLTSLCPPPHPLQRSGQATVGSPAWESLLCSLCAIWIIGCLLINKQMNKRRVYIFPFKFNLFRDVSPVFFSSCNFLDFPCL